jgi:hypothetical protein
MARTKEATVTLANQADRDEPSFAVSKREPAPAPSVYSGDAGLGLENVGADEQIIPFYRILQSNSPAVAGPVGRIAGAEAGMIINTATQEIFEASQGVMFVPSVRDHNFAKFTPRDSGGGFKGLFPADDNIVADCRARADRLYKEGKRPQDSRFGRLPCGDGDELIETYYLFGHFIAEETPLPRRGVVAFASTQIKAYKGMVAKLLSMTTLVNGRHVPFPLWAHRWRLTVVPQKNKKGDFWGWKVELWNQSSAASILEPKDALYLAGKDFYLEWRGGNVAADYKSSDAAEQAAAGEDPDAPPM